MNSDRLHCTPKCFLLILVSLCGVAVYLGSKLCFRKPGFLLQDSTTSALHDMLASTDGSKTLTLSNVTQTQKVEDITTSKDHRPLTVDFDPHGSDSLVVIHTQKTGGTEFLRHLVTLKQRGQYLCVLPPDLKQVIETQHKVPKRQKRSKSAKGRAKRAKNDHSVMLCPRDPSRPEGEQWLISEKTVRWVCGVHASYNRYSSCLPTLKNPKIGKKGRLHYAILLRHPVLRYLSEYFHVQRNATWSTPHICGGREVSEAEMPPCYPGYYQGRPWTNLSLSKFTSCESNWGNNRQTLMLADLESVHCFHKSALSKEERERRLLQTAKDNLKAFSFFGLTEYMFETCQLFEKTFGMQFGVLPSTKNLTELHSAPVLSDLWNNSVLYRAVEQANSLDLQLYDYALQLFKERAGRVGIVVDRGLVSKEVRQLRENPALLQRTAEKYKKLNYRIS